MCFAILPPGNKTKETPQVPCCLLRKVSNCCKTLCFLTMGSTFFWSRGAEKDTLIIPRFFQLASGAKSPRCRSGRSWTSLSRLIKMLDKMKRSPSHLVDHLATKKNGYGIMAHMLLEAILCCQARSTQDSSARSCASFNSLCQLSCQSGTKICHISVRSQDHSLFQKIVSPSTWSTTPPTLNMDLKSLERISIILPLEGISASPVPMFQDQHAGLSIRSRCSRSSWIDLRHQTHQFLVTATYLEPQKSDPFR